MLWLKKRIQKVPKEALMARRNENDFHHTVAMMDEQNSFPCHSVWFLICLSIHTHSHEPHPHGTLKEKGIHFLCRFEQFVIPEPRYGTTFRFQSWRILQRWSIWGFHRVRHVGFELAILSFQTHGHCFCVGGSSGISVSGSNNRKTWVRQRDVETRENHQHSSLRLHVDDKRLHHRWLRCWNGIRLTCDSWFSATHVDDA